MFVDFNILNQLGSPSINSNTFANRPAAGQTGRLFVSTDTFEIYRDNGTTWDLIGGPGSSTITGTGTATQVAFFTSSQAIGSSANLYWDNTTGALGINTSTPGAELDVHGTGIIQQLNVTSATGNTYLAFQRTGTGLWRLGDTYNSGNNFFELHNTVLAVDALEFEAATNKSSFQAQQTYSSGLARGNYFDFNVSVPNGTTFTSPNAITALGASLDLTLSGNATIPSGARTGLDAYNTVAFTSVGTLTMSQGTQIRAYSNLTAGWAFSGSATGTITHLAGLRVLFPENSGSAVTITNNYGLLINDQTANTGTVTYTNRWGIYQEGASDLNYFAANTLIGSTTNNGLKLQVTGQSYFSDNIGLAVTPSAWSVLKGFDVSTSGAFFGYSAQAGLSNNAYFNGSNWVYKNTASAAYFRATGSVFEWHQAASGTAGNAITFTQAMTLDANGNLLVGGTSVYGATITSYATSARSGGIGIRNSAGTIAGGFYTYASGSGSGSTDMYAEATGFLAFATASTERMRITSGGNIGIGTSSPLAVANYIGATISGTNGSFYALYTGATQNGRLETNGSTDVQLKSIANIPLVFGTNNTERARITNGGNFLVGTSTDAGQKLQLNGDFNLTSASPIIYYPRRIVMNGNNDFGINDNANVNNLLLLSSSGNLTLNGSVKTAAPTTGTAAAWKLGSRVAATVVVNTNEYIELDIGGVLYKLATVT